MPVENVEKSSPTLSASFFHWPLIARQDLSGSLIGRRRMTNQRLKRKSNAGSLPAAAKRLLTQEPAAPNICRPDACRSAVLRGGITGGLLLPQLVQENIAGEARTSEVGDDDDPVRLDRPVDHPQHQTACQRDQGAGRQVVGRLAGPDLPDLGDVRQ